MKDDAVYLRHIRDAIAKIEAYTAGGRDAFFADAMVQDAVIRNLEIIGEAVRNLSPELRRQHPGVPWRSITALRNVLAHEYFGVDLDIVWRLVSRRLPSSSNRLPLCCQRRRGDTRTGARPQSLLPRAVRRAGSA